MLIGIPKEIKNNENRVGITPLGVELLVQNGHQVMVQSGGGVGSGFTDEQYQEAGANVEASAEKVWSAEMIIKVKEPLESEYQYFRKDLIIFTYLHLANEPALTTALEESGTIAIGYETMVGEAGDLPLLNPMSVIAGRLSVQIGSQFLESQYGGKGVLIGGVPGVKNGKVVIIGGGVSGRNALQIALGMGAHCTVLDVKPEVLSEIEALYGADVITLMSNEVNIANAIKDADIVVGAVLIPGRKAPTLVTSEMVAGMQPGSVIVDIAVDQGGIFETEDHVTSHDDPVYVKHGVLHYAVPNMPGAVSRTSTIALTNVTLPYAVKIANEGYEAAGKSDMTIMTGFNVYKGKVTNKDVAESLDKEYVDIAKLIK
ncbi:alanine dehydrogenase [Jeotgalibaca ciconiae]|uniref:Alanine dehydrogenase n=1 Tax=Jeotgalibaca ciconiae TaxID=2496265 RepID=A0A3Q9BKY0_9LACT|nr:alanine dehydrogenase [Jeotgalibaca ciconiae]AZP04772.1 alanine dehydrogenase [Jeotgalibaca ciconiae]HJB24567.1 alanine dehydrogenase [Candidatus Jeotgalibaca pullicola]